MHGAYASVLKLKPALALEVRAGNLQKEGVVDTLELVFDDSPSARATLCWAAMYTRSTGTALRAIDLVDWPAALEMCVYPVVADYVYLVGSG